MLQKEPQKDGKSRGEEGNVAKGTSELRKFGKRRRGQPECNSGIRNRFLKRRLHLGSMRSFNKTFKQTVELEVA
jgi:hypothetical protein